MNILRLLGFFGLGIFLGLGPRLPDIVYDAPEPSLEIEAPQPNKYRISEPARTGDILINQLGYMTDDPKFASIVQPLSTPISWQIKDGTGHIVMTGKSRYFGQDPASGLLYHTVDFSALTIPADGYVLQAAGKSSAPFSVRRNLYGRLKTDALLYFTHSLAGAPIKAEFARQAQPPLTRPAGHKNRPTRCFSGRDLRGTQWPGCDYTLTPKGGWYDAGDYGRYITSTGFSVWAMLNTYERQQNGPASERYAFSDGKLPIAEHFNGTSDLLDIARVGIEFMLSMQIPQGKRAFVPRGPQLPIGPLSLQLTDVGGLVHHKVHGKTFPPLPKRPHEDTQPQYLYPPSTAASLHLAAIGAQCARIWKDIDPEFSDTCLTAAIRAYQAATVFSDIYAHDVFDGGGGYTDDNVKDEFFWASTELFLTTKDESYYPKMITYRSGVGESLHRRDTHTEYVEYLGLMSILAQYDHRTPEADLPDYVHEARNGITAVGQAFLEQARTSAFSLPYDDPKYYWGSNANLLGRAMVLAYGYNINKNPEFKAGIIHITDYLLGRNPLKTSYISGYGQTSMKSPHHRFWAHTLDPNFPAPPPGVLSGGPNNVNFSDPVAATLRGKCTGQTCWVDDAGAYTMNEVSISWNAVLFWVASYLDRPVREQP